MSGAVLAKHNTKDIGWLNKRIIISLYVAQGTAEEERIILKCQGEERKWLLLNYTLIILEKKKESPNKTFINIHFYPQRELRKWISFGRFRHQPMTSKERSRWDSLTAIATYRRLYWNYIGSLIKNVNEIKWCITHVVEGAGCLPLQLRLSERTIGITRSHVSVATLHHFKWYTIATGLFETFHHLEDRITLTNAQIERSPSSSSSWI